jgi:predicted nucleotidyltransferase
MGKKFFDNRFTKTILKYIQSCLSGKIALQSIQAIYIFGSVLDSNKFKSASDIDMAYKILINF